MKGKGYPSVCEPFLMVRMAYWLTIVGCIGAIVFAICGSVVTYATWQPSAPFAFLNYILFFSMGCLGVVCARLAHHAVVNAKKNTAFFMGLLTASLSIGSLVFLVPPMIDDAPFESAIANVFVIGIQVLLVICTALASGAYFVWYHRLQSSRGEGDSGTKAGGSNQA